MRRLAVLVLPILVSIPLAAAPASAHTYYCGHSTSGVHWAPDGAGWHRVKFVRHWDETRQGERRHMHTVQRHTVAGFPVGINAFYRCP